MKRTNFFQRLRWNYYLYCRSGCLELIQRYYKRDWLPFDRYAKKKIMSNDNMREWLKQKIVSNEPCLVSRFGAVELNVLRKIDAPRQNAVKIEKALEAFCNNAGFFPEDIELATRYVKGIKKHLHEIDLLIAWEQPMEEYYIRYYMPKTKLSYFSSLEPYYSKVPWTKALEGRKVLVIHPFKESIEKQYQKRELLFEDKNVLPKFELKCMKAVQTIAGEKDARFRDWFEALNYMYKEAMKMDFDIALIGCGAYGMALGMMLKKAGKQAIHMGGALQLLFGIKGGRWADFPYYNEHWVYPSEAETPRNAKRIENGCYW